MNGKSCWKFLKVNINYDQLARKSINSFTLFNMIIILLRFRIQNLYMNVPKITLLMCFPLKAVKRFSSVETPFYYVYDDVCSNGFLCGQWSQIHGVSNMIANIPFQINQNMIRWYDMIRRKFYMMYYSNQYSIIVLQKNKLGKNDIIYCIK